MKKSLASLLAAFGSLLGVFSFPWASGPARNTLRTRMVRMGPWFVTYSRDLPPYKTTVLVVHGEGCLLEVQHPLRPLLPERPELGTYFWACPTSDAEALRTLAERAIAEASGKKAIWEPGTRFLTFGIGRKGEDSVDSLASVALRGTVPPAVIAFDDAVIALAGKTLDHPYQILRASATLASTTLEPDGELAATLELANAGIVPLTIKNPAVGERTNVKLMLQDAQQDFLSIEPKKGEVTASSGTVPTLKAESAPLVTLKPGEVLSLSIKVRRHTYLRRGSYKVIARYKSEKEGIPEGKEVVGFVQVEAGTLTVGGRAAPQRRK